MLRDRQGNSLLDLFYPIGSFYETTNTNFNPNNSWGGTWVQDTAGMVLVAIDSTDTNINEVCKTYGEKTHKLTIDELAKHSHLLHIALGTEGTQTHYDLKGNWYSDIATNSDQIETTGGDQPHNNMQPSYVVCRWHRTA